MIGKLWLNKVQTGAFAQRREGMLIAHWQKFQMASSISCLSGSGLDNLFRMKRALEY